MARNLKVLNVALFMYNFMKFYMLLGELIYIFIYLYIRNFSTYYVL